MKAATSALVANPVIATCAANHRPKRLFQPFQRLDPRGVQHERGHGLGLSIVRAIAHTARRR